MKQLISLSGLSGVGKTHRREHDPALKDLPYLDIADIYAEYPDIAPNAALGVFTDRLLALMEDHDQIVLEAYFRPRSKQRTWIEYLAEQNGYQVEYIELEADPELCRERIRKQAGEEMLRCPERKEQITRTMTARLYLLDKICGESLPRQPC